MNKGMTKIGMKKEMTEGRFKEAKEKGSKEWVKGRREIDRKK